MAKFGKSCADDGGFAYVEVKSAKFCLHYQCEYFFIIIKRTCMAVMSEGGGELSGGDSDWFIE